MLNYEKEILTELVEEDGLLIMARGMGVERIFEGLIATYSNPSNLVIVIGASPQEAEYLVAEIISSTGVECEKQPRCVTSDVSVSDRSAVYKEGGVLFVTARILVVDFLMNRVPAAMITGIIVWKAHKILESCQEAFILRLYRQKNKTGFIKALTSSAISFTQGFCQVSRVMRNLFVKKLYLYPRFHLRISEDLELKKPEVIELHLHMTRSMLSLQSSLVDLVSSTVHELRLANKGLMDSDLLTTENALSPLFDRMVMSRLQPMWDQLSTRTKHLVGDLRLLRMINSYLSQYDCITFHNLTNSLRTTEKALHSSGWMMLPPAENLFLTSKKRVFGQNPTETLNSIKSKSGKPLKDGEGINPLGLTPEINPKWVALLEVLAEVRESCKQQEGPLTERCLIVTQDDSTALQLQQVLVEGSERVLLKQFYSTLGSKLNVTPPPLLFSKPEKKKEFRGKKRKKFEHFTKAPVSKSEADEKSSKKLKQFLETEEIDKPENEKTENEAQSSKSVENESKEGEDANETITLTQIKEKYKFLGDSSDSDSDECDEEERERRKEAKRVRKEKLKAKEEDKKRRKNLFSSPLILVQSLKNYSEPYTLPRILRDVQPRYIIMYDSDLEFVRQLEIWQAEGAPHQCLVYLMIYKGTTEEQLYLTHVKREKDAFHYLIKEKSSLVLPEDTDGLSSDHPDLVRDPRSNAEKNLDSLPSNSVSRKGGKEKEQPEDSRIIVDMREFRSELPSLLHKRGIEIDPVTIEVGDYILTPSMCVERKSISDLVGSLNNGRLYSQAVSMSRHYAKPMLLIEFDQNKPFHLQTSVLTTARGASSFGSLHQGEPDNRDVYSKLQLLTIHFPKLRILWCSSPYATAEIFSILKVGKPEPDVEKAQAIKSDSCSIDEMEKFNPIIHDFVSKLPGVTTKNIYSLMRKIKDLPTLLTMDKVQLTELMGNSVNAAQLYNALHCTLKEEDIMAEANRKGGKYKTTRKGLPKFGSAK